MNLPDFNSGPQLGPSPTLIIVGIVGLLLSIAAYNWYERRRLTKKRERSGQSSRRQRRSMEAVGERRDPR